MTDDELDAAAGRLVQSAEAGGGCGSPYGPPPKLDTFNCDLHDLASAWLARPRWRERPTVAGVYVMPAVLADDYLTWIVTHDQIADWKHGRIFGPIPPDTEATDAPPEMPG